MNIPRKGLTSHQGDRIWYPTKIVCLGLNYIDHARELHQPIPKEPLIFLKPPSALTFDGCEVLVPRDIGRVDYEIELGVVIGKRAKSVKPQEVRDIVAGFTVFIDITARDLQRLDGQWTRAKSFDTFAPTGPHVVSWQEVGDPNNLKMKLWVNDQVKQDSCTCKMIFKVEEVVAYISRIMTLEPGDIIATGTPPGVGPFKPGDVLRAQIERIGTLTVYTKLIE